jgi:hypothetical protein
LPEIPHKFSILPSKNPSHVEGFFIVTIRGLDTYAIICIVRKFLGGIMNDENNSISKYDRLRGGLEGVALFTKPSTIKNVQTITGKTETFVIETGRYDELGGDFIFVECIDETGTTRVALPPKVANVIASQRDSLTARRRSAASKRIAQARKERGELPGFMKGKKVK